MRIKLTVLGAAALISVLASVHIAPLAGVFVAVYTAGGVGVWLTRERRRRHEEYNTLIADACATLAADLAVGSTPHSAVQEVARRIYARTLMAEWRNVMTVAQEHGDIPAALDAAAHAHTHTDTEARTEFTPVHTVAAAWKLAGSSGSSHLHTLRGVESELLAEKQLASEIRVHTASARATSSILFLLPSVGVGVGYILGTDPLHTVFASPLGITAAVIATVLHLAGWWWAQRLTQPPRRGVMSPRAPQRPPQPWIVFSAALSAGVCIGVLLGGVTGLIGGILGAVGVRYGAQFLQKREQENTAKRDVSLLPVALTLLAAELQAGQPVSRAIERIGGVSPSQIGQWWMSVAAALQRGATPLHAWRAEARPNLPYLDTVAEIMVRSTETGAACADRCKALSQRVRQELHTQFRAQAQQNGVLLILPLTLCFLPAFALWGVMPTLLELFGEQASTL